jgi:hypothetical protein
MYSPSASSGARIAWRDKRKSLAPKKVVRPSAELGWRVDLVQNVFSAVSAGTGEHAQRRARDAASFSFNRARISALFIVLSKHDQPASVVPA